jgi:trypsin-like peptidase/uncharacterized protein DUF4189
MALVNLRRGHTQMTRKLMIALCALAYAFLIWPAFASSGTGFAVANGTFLLTNFHVVDGCTTVNVLGVGIGTVKFADRKIDIAVIEPERPLAASLRFRASDQQVKLGEEIIVVGFPLKGLLSSGPTVTTGIVSSLAGIRDDANRWQISAPVQPGNSGGPVLDRAGNVVGIVVSKLNALKIAPLTGDIPQNVNFAIPASIVTPILNARSIKYRTGTFETAKPVSDIVSAASSAVVSLECLAKDALRPPAAAPIISGQPDRYGAIAWDRGSGKYGVSWNQPTPKRAEEVALSECGADGCKVVSRIGPAMCGALATTEDGKHAGAAWRKDRADARLASLTNCEKDKAGDCIVRVTDCNK